MLADVQAPSKRGCRTVFPTRRLGGRGGPPDSIDLASEDREIFVALARDAQTMLSLEPAAVQDFMLEWLNPQGGEPGWVWTAAGVDQNFATKLRAGLVLVEG